MLAEYHRQSNGLAKKIMNKRKKIDEITDPCGTPASLDIVNYQRTKSFSFYNPNNDKYLSLPVSFTVFSL